MTWLFGLIWLPLVFCFGIGVLLSTVWWGWRRRAIHAEYEKRRLAAEAESDRLRLRVSSLKVSEARADDLQLDLEKAQTDSKKVPALEKELRELRLQVGLVTELENQITNLRSRADQADHLERRVAELEAHLDVYRRNAISGDTTDVPAGRDNTDDQDDTSADDDTSAKVIDLRIGSTQVDSPGTDELGLLQVSHADDLKVIKGIGPSLETRLNELGIRAWEQVAALSADQVDTIGRMIAIFPGRINRDRWVEQAADFVARYPSTDPYDRPTKETIKKPR